MGRNRVLVLGGNFGGLTGVPNTILDKPVPLTGPRTTGSRCIPCSPSRCCVRRRCSYYGRCSVSCRLSAQCLFQQAAGDAGGKDPRGQAH